MASHLRRTEDLQRLKTREFNFQYTDGSFPPQYALMTIADTIGNADWTQNPIVRSIELVDQNGRRHVLTADVSDGLMYDGHPVASKTYPLTRFFTTKQTLIAGQNAVLLTWPAGFWPESGAILRDNWVCSVAGVNASALFATPPAFTAFCDASGSVWKLLTVTNVPGTYDIDIMAMPTQIATDKRADTPITTWNLLASGTPQVGPFVPNNALSPVVTGITWPANLVYVSQIISITVSASTNLYYYYNTSISTAADYTDARLQFGTNPNDGGVGTLRREIFGDGAGNKVGSNGISDTITISDQPTLLKIFGTFVGNTATNLINKAALTQLSWIVGYPIYAVGGGSVSTFTITYSY